MKIKFLKIFFQTSRKPGGLSVILLSKGGQKFDGKTTCNRTKNANS